MKKTRGERGQVLPITVLLLVVLVGMVGLAIDVGRLYVAKARLSRAIDSAALAGVLELPNVSSAQSQATAYLHEHEPSAAANFPASASNSLKVEASMPVELTFMRILGIKNFSVKASAAAGFGFVPSDSAMIIDATGSMGDPPCNGAQNNAGCPIKEAKDAASGFVDTLLAGSSGYAQLAFSPFRGCYNPPLNVSNCVPTSMQVDFTKSASAVHTAINNTNSTGGSGTNVCLGMYQAQQFFADPAAQKGSNVVRSVVLLTDGDNNFNPIAYGNGAPPPSCRPNTDPSKPDGTPSACSSAGTRERELDVKTVALVDQLKAQGIAVYVVAFGTCGSADNTTPGASWCSTIGNNDPDTVADRRLLKCIASSKSGTNDHYFEVAKATDLPAVFQKIAQAIGFRLTE